MVVKQLGEDFIPYAPFSAVVDVIHRFRERGLPDPLTLLALEQVGVSPSMTGVVAKALVFLKLIDESGNRTQAFERIRKATSEEYPQVIAEIVRGAYINIFSIIDPAQDNKQQIDDAFRRYEPSNQRAKMVRLFLGLCEEAGVIDKKPRSAYPQTGVTRSVKRETKKELPSKRENNHLSGEKETKNEPTDKLDIAPNQRLLSAIFQQLPLGAKWTTSKRQKWITAMTAAVDLMVEVTEEDPAINSDSKPKEQNQQG